MTENLIYPPRVSVQVESLDLDSGTRLKLKQQEKDDLLEWELPFYERINSLWP